MCNFTVRNNPVIINDNKIEAKKEVVKNNVTIPSNPVSTLSQKDEQNTSKIKFASSSSNSFNFPEKNKTEGGEGLATTNKDSISGKYYIDNLTNNKGLGDKVNLDSKESRISFSNSTTQLSAASSNENTFGCGPSCIVNGAMIQGGKKGLTDLIKVIKSKGSDSFEKPFPTSNAWKKIPNFDKLGEIENRINNNNLTRQDLVDLQKIVYCQLRHMENPEKDNGDGTASIKIGKVKEYINTDLSTFGVFKEQPLKDAFSNMNIKLLDTDGDRTTSEHFVLFFNSKDQGNEDSIFDPWPRKDGNQIVKDSGQIQDYHNAVLNAIR